MFGKKYSMFDNLKYVISGMKRWGGKLLLIQAFSTILDCVELFIVPVLVKLIIQQLEMKVAVNQIIALIGVYSVLVLGVYLFQGFVTNQIPWRMDYVLIRFKRELMNTMMSMKYSDMENPKVLDEHEKIRNVMNNKDAGIEGMMNSSVKCGKFILQITVSAILISNLNFILVIGLVVLLLLTFRPLNEAKRIDKIEVWDALGPFWRKHFNLGYLTTNFGSAKDIRMYNMQDMIYGKYMEVNSGIQEKYVHSRNIWLKTHSIVKLLEMLQEIFLYGFLLYSLVKGNLTVSNFTLYVSSVHIFTKAVNDFVLEFADMKKQTNDVADFRRFVDNYSLPTSESKEAIPSKLDITFQDVSFCYEGQKKNALENISVTISHGQRVAIVGLNGAGKTTFVKLLCGLYSVSSGKIEMNGKNIEEFDKSHLFNCFSAVFQNVEVYPFSVAENVSMKVSEKTDYSKVNECLKKSGLCEKIESLPYRENTQVLKVIDSEGVDFSGGEKQKLALARAMYKDAPIVILDEPTAALDPLAEERLYCSFDEILGNKTGLYISHRLSSTRFCDNILLFEDGRIVESGTHDELMQLKGKYYTLYEIQAKNYKEGNGGSDE